jgi:hypothetical protein
MVSTLNEWISKLVRDLVLSRKCNNESKIERFGFIHISEFYTWIFFKSSFHLEKKNN